MKKLFFLNHIEIASKLNCTSKSMLVVFDNKLYIYQKIIARRFYICCFELDSFFKLRINASSNFNLFVESTEKDIFDIWFRAILKNFQ